jgi:circadian clock protein KaiB
LKKAKSKSPPKRITGLQALERAAAAGKSDRYDLKLFVTGSTPRSLEAIARIKEICESQLKGRYSLEVIDVHQEPHLAEMEQIIALPTLLKKLPPPLRKVLGFSEKERLLAILGIAPAKKKP